MTESTDGSLPPPNKGREAANRRNAKYRARHREQINATARAKHAADPEKVNAPARERYTRWTLEQKEASRASWRRYRDRTREEQIERTRAWRKANPEKQAAATKHWYDANRTPERKARATEKADAWRKANPERYSLIRKGIKARRRSQTSRSMTKLDRRKSALYRKRIKNDPCFYCGKRAKKMTDDHVYPLSRGGTDHWFNLVRACGSCNSRKHAKLFSEFLRS